MEEGDGDGGGGMVAANVAVGFISGNGSRKTRWWWSQLKSMIVIAPGN